MTQGLRQQRYDICRSMGVRLRACYGEMRDILRALCMIARSFPLSIVTFVFEAE